MGMVKAMQQQFAQVSEIDAETVKSVTDSVLSDFKNLLSNVGNRVSLAQADAAEERRKMLAAAPVDPKTIDIGDELRARVDMRMAEWVEKEVAARDVEKAKRKPNRDEFQRKIDRSLSAGVVNTYFAPGVKAEMTLNVQKAIAKEMNEGRMSKDRFGRLDLQQVNIDSKSSVAATTVGASKRRSASL